MSEPGPRDPRPAFKLPGIQGELVFVVEDDPTMREGLQRFLEGVGYDVRSFDRPDAALDEIRVDPPKVLVTDHDMPAMTGLALAQQALEIDPDLKIVMITGAGTEEIAQGALRLGVTDYVMKPFDLEELEGTVRNAFVEHARVEFARRTDAWLRGEVHRQTRVIRKVTLGTLTSLLNAIEARTPHFKGHSSDVAACAVGIAENLELPRHVTGSIRTAGLLHDVGMISVPDAVVNKPGELDRGEYETIVEHCRKGAKILEPMEHLGPVNRFVLEHHERLDGSGYPDHKKGDEISLGGQIVGLAEVWVALTEDRPFRDRMSRVDAMATLAGTAGSWFADDLIKALQVSQAPT